MSSASNNRLREKINSMLYERTAISKKPAEDAILRELETFLLELGNGFAFRGRQTRKRY